MKRLFIAACLIALTLPPVSANDQRARVLMQAAEAKAKVEGDLKAAVKLYQDAEKEAGSNRALVAQVLLKMAEAFQELGEAQSQTIYRRIVNDFGDQRGPATVARARLAEAPRRVPGSREGLRQQHLWSNSFVEGSPSPDGRYVAWFDYPAGKNTGTANLMIHDLATGQDRPITRVPLGAGFGESPYFTPDGEQLVYLWFDFKRNEWDVRMISVDGSNERRVFHQPVGALINGPISPDGKLMAALVQPNRGNRQIAIGNLATGAIAILKSVDWRDPLIGNFSPDGKFVVYSARVQQTSSDREIFVLAIDGSSESRIIEAPGENRMPFFTPDGMHVVFASNRSGRWDLWSVPVDHGKPTGVPAVAKVDIGSINGMGFSRDGRFFYQHRIDESDIYEVDIDTLTHQVTSDPRRMSDRYVHSSAAGAWSPDGRTLAYVGWRGQSGTTAGGDRILVLRETASGTEREVPITMERVTSTLRWFPDGNSLLFTAISGGRRFQHVQVQTGEVRTVLTMPYSPSVTTATMADGSFLFTMVKDGEKRIVRHDIATRAESTVYALRQGGVAFHGFSASPDKQRMVYKASYENAEGSTNWRVMLADLSEGEPHELWRSPTGFVGASAPVWDPAGRGVYVSVSDDIFATKAEIWWVPVDGAAHSTGLTLPVPDIAGGYVVQDVHPSGRRLLVAGGKTETQIWTLDNLPGARR